MIDHVWTVLCSHAVIDCESNNVSLHNVLEQLAVAVKEAPQPDAKAAIPLDMELVTLWARSDLEVPVQGRGRTTLLSPAGEALLGPTEFNIDLSGPYRRSRSRMRLQGLPVKGSGRYTFLVELQDQDQIKWRKVATVPLGVTIELAPPEGK